VDSFRRCLLGEDRDLEPVPVFVNGVDLRYDTNCRNHYTNFFGQLRDKLVLRRGASFAVRLAESKPDLAKTVVFCLAGTGLSFTATTDRGHPGNSGGWSLEEGTEGLLEIQIAPDAPVGAYNAEVVLGSDSKRPFPKQIVVLCNPWAEADDVYIADEDHRQEFVVEDDGAIWYGMHGYERPRAWAFGQYEDGVLDACLKLVDKCPGDRGDVVQLARHLCAAMSHLGESGVLVGNWSGQYDGGTPPAAWVGSAPILRQWAASGPVKFGQCWVFSGLLTTVCRCLGIPARSVTCFVCAHDASVNRVVDRFFDANGEKLKIGGDRIWNFHVWSEAWFRRQDLRGSAHGWQIIDATPQERSGAMWQCGPASLAEIRAGKSQSNFDLEFVTGGVNADVRYYMIDEKGERKLTRVDPYHVGRSLITKAVGGYVANDITSAYKHDEDTVAERMALLAEAIDSTYAHAENGTFTLSREGDCTLGANATFKLRLKDDAQDKWLCRMAVRATSYMGRELEVMAESTKMLEAGEDLAISVPPADYSKYLADTGLCVSALVHCVNFKKDAVWLDEAVSSMQTPQLKVVAPTARPLSSPVRVHWKNPLPVPLRGVLVDVGKPHIRTLTRHDVAERSPPPVSSAFEWWPSCWVDP